MKRKPRIQTPSVSASVTFYCYADGKVTADLWGDAVGLCDWLFATAEGGVK